MSSLLGGYAVFAYNFGDTAHRSFAYNFGQGLVGPLLSGVTMEDGLGWVYSPSSFFLAAAFSSAQEEAA